MSSFLLVSACLHEKAPPERGCILNDYVCELTDELELESLDPLDTLWELDPHTLGKHLVLRAYLDAWLPVMGSWQGRLLFIDGFAGPGEYEGGEEGSPRRCQSKLT